MATHTLKLSTASLGGLTAVQVSAALAAADVATIDQSIADDQAIVSMNLGPSASTIQAAIIFTADITTTQMSGLTNVSISTPATATIASIRPGQWIYGPSIPTGQQVLSASGTTIHMTGTDTPTAVATGNTYFVTGRRLAGSFSTNGELFIPNRGVLKLFPGDYVAVDNSGWPILLSAESVAYANSSWIFT